jgi:uncharacterized repeat protein (TIGR03803 family)
MSLAQGLDGNFYGTTLFGGAHGGGTVFKITPTGTLTPLYSFCSKTGCTDGYQPVAGLVLANGNFYGTTSSGGAHDYGTVFKITPTGTLTTLHSFASTDGANPEARLFQGTDGNFYGTTHSGGAHGGGTVFKITASGRLTLLYSFCPTTGCADGVYPWAGLVQGTDGNFYGTTLGGGTNGNYGTIFKINSTGTLTTLHSFCSKTSCTDGVFPYAGLVQGTDGNFYGTTSGGGTLLRGTVFKINSTGALTTLHSFVGTDGTAPYAGPVQATDGNFYGTVSGGGANGFGTVFKITPTGTLNTLHNFTGTDGSNVTGGLVQGTNGNFYGTTQNGGTNSDGTVFTISVHLGID